MTTIPPCLEIQDSPIDGKGVFALQDIPTGTCLGKYTGVKYTRKEFIEKYGNDFRYCYFTRMSWIPIVCAKENRHFMTYLNESNTPNVFFKRYKLYAKRNIVKGEELTLKYPGGYTRTYSEPKDVQKKLNNIFML